MIKDKNYNLRIRSDDVRIMMGAAHRLRKERSLKQETIIRLSFGKLDKAKHL